MDRDVLECSLDFAKLADPMKDVLTCEHGRMRFGGIEVSSGDVYTGDPGAEYRHLPTCTKVGDVVAFFDVGAYSLECMSGYNGRDHAAAYMITESGLWQTAARRTVEDFVAGERFAPNAVTE